MYQIDIWLELNFLFKTINGLLIRLILTDFAITNEIGGEFGWNFRFGFPQNSPVHLYEYSDAIPDANLLSAHPTIDPLS